MRWIVLKAIHELAALIKAISRLHELNDEGERLYAEMRDGRTGTSSLQQQDPVQSDRADALAMVEPRHVKSVRLRVARPADV